MRKSITANGTDKILTTGRDINHFYVFCPTGATLGGGTLTLSIRERDTGNTLIDIDTLIAGDQAQYPVGGDVELHYTLAGATTPSIELMVTQGR